MNEVVTTGLGHILWEVKCFLPQHLEIPRTYFLTLASPPTSLHFLNFNIYGYPEDLIFCVLTHHTKFIFY